MVTSIRNPTAVVATETTLGAGTLAWSTTTNIYTENAAYAYTAVMPSTGTLYGYYKLYDSTGYVGDLMNYGTIPTALGWTTDTAFTGALGLTVDKVNNSSFGVGQYFMRGTTKSLDIRTSGYGFAIPAGSTILGASSRSKQYFYSTTRVFRVDVVELTVSYELGGSQSPSSNAYFGGGPAMFRCPTDLFNILKKPIWAQTSYSRSFV